MMQYRLSIIFAAYNGKRLRMRSLFIVCICLSYFSFLSGQTIEAKLQPQLTELEALQQKKLKVEAEVEQIRLDHLLHSIQKAGYPKGRSNQIVEHRAMALSYNEKHEQADWVMHMISPAIKDGVVFRTNDFRVDSAVSTGTAVEHDYFLKFLQPDSSYTYDGFGYDRGHLAPSADFRWSATALSESYYYSNMSPQLPEFNREIWGKLENLMRAYVMRYEVPLLVVTGPILENNLPVIERSENKVTIPKAFWKVAIDVKNKRGIGFILPHEGIDYPLSSFAFPINKIEVEADLDFFSKLPQNVQDTLEKNYDASAWFTDRVAGDQDPIYPPSLPRNHFNTVQSKLYMGDNKRRTVCGTVVSIRKSRKGNILMNIDKKFPNHVFTVFIRKENIPNFSYDPIQVMMGEEACFTEKILNLGGTPTMFIDREKRISFDIQYESR